jgi:hypothetical protein
VAPPSTTDDDGAVAHLTSRPVTILLNFVFFAVVSSLRCLLWWKPAERLCLATDSALGVAVAVG